MAKLRRLIDDNNIKPRIKARKPMFKLLYAEFDYLIGLCFKEEDELKDVGNNWKRRLIETAQAAEDSIDTLMSSANHSFEGVMIDLSYIRAEIMNNNKGNLLHNLVEQDMMMDNKFKATRTNENTRVNISVTEHEKFIAGFEEDTLLMLDRLTGDRKKLDIISIVGMGGQGKTTLATKIFDDSLVKYHFEKRGWAIVSQAYSKQSMLLQLLASIGKSVDEAVSESKLCEMLYQSLKGRRYLIVIDDIWSCKAWDDVRICFPDDKTGSRVLVTTRLTKVSLHISRGGFTHNLQLLTEDQSWELCRKTFRGRECPESLIETGKHIAKKCGGLPLALVVIAGLLEKGETRKVLWEKIAKSVSSYIINDPKGCLDTLALSYDHLPFHLKKCFLYVGGFPEDYKIQVKRLIRLWMAEGFIKRVDQRSLEEEGERYLMDLIDRNLLVVADRRSSGGIKSCCLHDLLREVCLEKASEEKFFKKMSMPMSKINFFFNSVSSISKQRLFTDYEVLCKICSHDFAPHTRSVLCFPDSRRPEYLRTASWLGSFLLLRVLDLLNIPIFSFSSISLLLHLKYLAVWSCGHEFSFSKANYGSLQTLFVKGMLSNFIYSPDNMVNLRHLRFDRIHIPISFSAPALFNLQTISRLILDHRTQLLLESFPDIKRLGCAVSSESTNNGLLSFVMLTHLEALHVEKHTHESLTLTNPIRFPESLRKLTLSGLLLPWNHTSTIQRLPNLEVLKLLESSFWGDLWETEDGQFHRLKYLKLEKLNLRVWEASSINFPRLRKLVVRGCENLNKIPLELGNMYTLEHFEIDYSSIHVRDSVYRIQKAQHEMENDDLHVILTHTIRDIRPANLTPVYTSEVFFMGNPFFH
ncbi:putative late blight resistance protein homolog R1B-14 [Bidens hawaiensis]|uniref:putative late blight resistance protein homolog R1B-14 n=1 Tax=Bidens hawaiensis TaxID=980011 RepID=UPI0040496D74